MENFEYFKWKWVEYIWTYLTTSSTRREWLWNMLCSWPYGSSIFRICHLNLSQTASKKCLLHISMNKRPVLCMFFTYILHMMIMTTWIKFSASSLYIFAKSFCQKSRVLTSLVTMCWYPPMCSQNLSVLHWHNKELADWAIYVVYLAWVWQFRQFIWIQDFNTR